MLTDEVQAAFGESLMKMTRFLLALTALITATACSSERIAAPSAAPISSQLVGSQSQVPLLYIVDGVRLQRDQVPTLTSDEVAQVQVLKGRAALKQYGPDASYGVVIITTKAAAARRS
jgi:hypothetical protein